MFFDFFHWFANDGRAWITAVAQGHPFWVLPIAFVIVLLSLGGVIGATHIGLFPAVAGAVLGSILGDWISWWIGFHYHHKIVHFALFRRFEEHIEKGLHFFHRWGTWAIFIGRFMGPFRATVPLVAGMSELEFWPFMIANAASAVIWAVALLAFPALAAHYLIP